MFRLAKNVESKLRLIVYFSKSLAEDILLRMYFYTLLKVKAKCLFSHTLYHRFQNKLQRPHINISGTRR